ncbi:MAG: hypothetical protein JWR43_242 [Phenylobacterium sp.]|nr:hypothetical protein [Phenylobacterium sp.]
MTPDNFDEFMPQPARRRGASTRHILFAGVAGACVLGVGLGLWARPAMNERRMAAAAPVAPVKPAAPTRRLEIVVDDRPAPIGAPIEVLSKTLAAPAQAVRPEPPSEPEPQAPIRPPQGLMRVQATTPPAPDLAPAAAKQTPRPRLQAPPAPALAAPKLTIAKARPLAPPTRFAKIEPAPAKPSRKAELASAQAARAHSIELARAEAAAHKAQLARAETAKAHKAELARAEAARTAAHKVELAKAAKAARQDQLRLAKAEAKGRAEARAEAKTEALAQARQEARSRTQLAGLMHALARAAHHKATPQEPPPAQLARLDRKSKARHELKVAWAAARKPPRRAEPSYRARAVQQAPQPASGLMKVSTTPRCANHDAGAALVCADPSLGAADRQLARAYQGARAAGVPDAQLQRQQQRWLAARSAAAREAPWAVHDVYLARIAELNGQAHDAHGDGY